MPGRSAMESARAWCPDAGPCVPAEIRALLDSIPALAGAEISAVYPERKVRFDELRGEPRNADVAAVAEHPEGRIAISIEAKADEPFDRPVREVLMAIDARIAEGERSNGRLRVEQLVSALLPAGTSAEALRYQLLTAAAGAIAFAAEQQATRAVLIVHEFVSDATNAERRATNQTDLDRFLAAISAGRFHELSAGRLVGPIAIPGAPLFDGPVPLFVGKSVRRLD
ncbi:MAG TPA: hypothetical protein VEA99_13680 [Gemmatimonadaceae bacterium]|nr:hypothetical protein [Gemmatimonadaceae bacterium]